MIPTVRPTTMQVYLVEVKAASKPLKQMIVAKLAVLL
jgi:hypothetical protein